MVLALVLGDRAEENFRNAIKGSQGDLMVFFSNWLVGGVITLGLIMLLWPLIGQFIGRLRSAKPHAA
jgi:putative tricarboxylic transport membrane protein